VDFDAGHEEFGVGAGFDHFWINRLPELSQPMPLSCRESKILGRDQHIRDAPDLNLPSMFLRLRQVIGRLHP
jgi:hypothetical protein